MNTLLALSFWIHLIGVAIWVGVSILMPVLIMPILQTLEPAARMKFMSAWTPKAAPIINVAIVLVVLSGIALIGLKYGTYNVLGLNVLTAKLFVTILMMANGIYVGVVLAKRIGTLAPAPGTPPSPQFLKTQKMLNMHSWVQFGLAILALLLVGFLTAVAVKTAST